jgi:hypothetical protein
MLRFSPLAVAVIALTVGGAAVASIAPNTATSSSGGSDFSGEFRLHFRLAHPDPSRRARPAREFEARTSPGSPLFRKHMTLDEVTELFGAPEDTIHAVQSWLTARGVSHGAVSATRDTITLPGATIAALGDVAAELDLASVDVALLGRKLRPVSRPVPADLARAGVSAVLAVPTRAVHTVQDRNKRVSSRTAGDPFPGVTQNPTTIRARYGIPATAVPTSDNVSQAVAEFEGEQFLQANLVAFAAKYDPGFSATQVQVSGPNKGGYFGEGNLDLEYLTAFAETTPTWWVEEKEFDLTSWCERFLTITPVPTVASISWAAARAATTSRRPRAIRSCL